MTFSTLFEQAQLAEAAYADLWDVNLNTAITARDDVKAKLIAEGFSDSQATEFVNHWRVVDHISDTESGFSATLFERLDSGGNSTGQFSLAIRGSTFVDYAVDFQADLGDIFLDGVALDQLVDLYNYWQRLATPAPSTYAAAKLEALSAETAALNAAYLLGSAAGLAYEAELRARPEILIDYPTRTVRTIQFVDSSTLSDANLRQGAGVFQTELSALSVSGHSLGGHLAMAFTRLFSGLNAGALAVNGLGFLPTNTNVGHLFAMLGGASGFDSGKILNVYGLAGPEFAAQNNYLIQVGGYEGIYIESAGISQAFGHSAKQMTDSLALYDLFARIDPALNTPDPAVGIGKITEFLKAASGTPAFSLEAALDSLRKLFKDPAAANPALTATDNREQFYQNLLDSGFQQRVAAYAGQLSISPLTDIAAADLANLAQGSTALAYRYALRELNPFAVVGNNDLYAPHNPNGELDLYEPVNRTGTLTADWITDRAKLLYAQLIRNTQDNPDLARLPGSGDRVTEYRHYRNGKEEVFFAQYANWLPNQFPTQVVMFADDTGRSLIGSDNLLGDRLYGGSSTDYLIGRANGVYDGETGGDIAYGDMGNDELYAEAKIALAQAITQGNTGAASTAKGDWLSGELLQCRYLHGMREAP